MIVITSERSSTRTTANCMPSTHRQSVDLLNNHGRILLAVACTPTSTMRQLARQLELTERAVFSIIDDLRRAGMVTQTKVGRTNSYTVDPEMPIGTGREASITVGDLLGLLGPV